MTEPNYTRRRAMIGAAAGGAIISAGGAGAFVMNKRGFARYQTAVDATWRHGDARDLDFAEARQELVRYGTLAANSHNTQPWNFRGAERIITVQPDFSRALSAVDPDNHHLFASLGCAVENIVQSAGNFGLQAIPEYEPVTHEIRLNLQSAPRVRTALFDAIPRRQSTRADFDGRPITADAFRQLEASGQGAGVRMLLLTEPKQREDILAFVLAGNTAQIADAAFVAELTAWIRFSYDDAVATRDGLFAKASGSPTLPGWVGRLAFPLLFTRDAENQKYTSQLRSSSGVAVFVSDRNEPACWIEAGRCCQRFALQATALQLRHSFINQPVEVPAVREQLAVYLGVAGHRPDLIMRFGHGPDLPRSLRRLTDQVTSQM